MKSSFCARRFVVYFLVWLAIPWAASPCLGIDLSSSDRSGRYPWEGVSVYEEIGVLKLPSHRFNQDLMALMAKTPFGSTMTTPMELRPISVAAVVGHILGENGPDGWSAVKGDPNPVLEPILTGLLGVFSGNQTRAAQVATELASYPLMMPDSGGSAVLELRNPKLEAVVLDKDPLFSLMLPIKVGFWVDGDLLHIDLLNPTALVSLYFNGRAEEEDLSAWAVEVEKSLFKSVAEALFSVFDPQAIALYKKALPPYLDDMQGIAESPTIQIGTLQSGPGLGEISEYLLSTSNPYHPFSAPFFQTYSAFDGISGFLESALAHPYDMTAWLPTPDGQVVDDILYLNNKTAHSSEDLPMIREILTPMFRQTFLAPRGHSVMYFSTSGGTEIASIDIGSPYYGQILLRMGAHRAPGTPCKVVLIKRGDLITCHVINPVFMFKGFFGDIHPERVDSWEGAFNWPYGLGLIDLGKEAEALFLAQTAMALDELGRTRGLEVQLSTEAQEALEALSNGAR